MWLFDIVILSGGNGLACESVYEVERPVVCRRHHPRCRNLDMIVTSPGRKPSTSLGMTDGRHRALLRLGLWRET